MLCFGQNIVNHVLTFLLIAAIHVEKAAMDLLINTIVNTYYKITTTNICRCHMVLFIVKLPFDA